jgi:hypothetical protein
MNEAFWVSICGLVAFGPGLVAWFIRSKLRKRRKALFAAQMAAHYQKMRPALPATEPKPDSNLPGQQITVAELVARIEAERMPTSLDPMRTKKSRNPPCYSGRTSTAGR